MFRTLRRLRERGVIGLNGRNLDYISRYNARQLYPLVDDKYLTKQLALRAGVAVPELYAMVEIQRQALDIPRLTEGKRGFAVKPSMGSGGEGVIIITGPAKDGFRRSNGEIISREDLNYHISRILAGVYSLGGQPDKALVEYRVDPSPVLADVSYLGVPDIRIIVFLGVPVMSMARLPTRSSQGRANLHQGAIGVGIDIATGATLSGVWRNEIIFEHPDMGCPIVGINIPDWDQLLLLASRCFDLTGLGYQGVDIVLDKQKGPLLLELNARPGLAIQIANNYGLLPRLKMVECEATALKTAEERVDFAKQKFGVPIPAVPGTAIVN